jgi:hypothetical protein
MFPQQSKSRTAQPAPAKDDIFSSPPPRTAKTIPLLRICKQMHALHFNDAGNGDCPRPFSFIDRSRNFNVLSDKRKQA